MEKQFSLNCGALKKQIPISPARPFQPRPTTATDSTHAASEMRSGATTDQPISEPTKSNKPMKTTCLQLSAAMFAWMLAAGTSLAAWQKGAISIDWREASANAIQIGPGRNDGILRLYSALAENDCYGYGAVAEHSYANGAWTNVLVWTFIPATSPCGDRRGTCVAVGAARYDGVNRVYASHNENYLPYGVMDEFTYSAGQWSELGTQSAYSSDTVALVLGDGRNDGTVHAYQGGGPAGGPTNVVAEFTYAFGAFTTTNIAILPSGIRGMALANGRNDGRQRIYTASEDGNVYELSFANGTWSQTAINVVPANLRSIAVGSGRNDGLQRLYVGCLDSHIYELTYQGGNWVTVDLGYGGQSMRGVALGAGRNDGVTRVYGSCYDSHMYEFSYVGGSWEKSDLGTGTGAMLCVTVGSGRNDGVVRVYGGNADANIYEFSYSEPCAPSAIVSQPQSQTVNAGAPANFSVTASGSLPLSYRWRFNGLDLSDGGQISGAASTSATISSVQSGNAGDYSVVVTNACGAVTSAVATLTVRVPPSITMQPVSQTISLGDQVTLSVAADGTPPLYFQWQLNGTNIAGATGLSYTISSAQAAQAGYYTVIVSNAAGTVTSTNASLSFLGLQMYAGLTIIGTIGANYRVEYATNLASPIFWIVLTNFTLLNNPDRFVDWDSAGLPRRFYRAITP